MRETEGGNVDDIREKLETAIQDMKRVRNHYEGEVTRYVPEAESPLPKPVDMIVSVNDALVVLQRALLAVCAADS